MSFTRFKGLRRHDKRLALEIQPAMRPAMRVPGGRHVDGAGLVVAAVGGGLDDIVAALVSAYRAPRHERLRHVDRPCLVIPTAIHWHDGVGLRRARDQVVGGVGVVAIPAPSSRARSNGPGNRFPRASARRRMPAHAFADRK